MNIYLLMIISIIVRYKCIYNNYFIIIIHSSSLIVNTLTEVSSTQDTHCSYLKLTNTIFDVCLT